MISCHRLTRWVGLGFLLSSGLFGAPQSGTSLFRTWLNGPGTAVVAAAEPKAVEPKVVDYSRDVKPILAARCVACHGVLKQAGGLRLDTAAFALRGGDSGPALAPGKAGESLILERLTSTDPATRMPLDAEPLKAEQIEAIRGWIEQGAVAPADEQPETDPRDHWAFRPVVRPPVPALPASGWARNPIDAFLASEHARRGLRVQREATRDELVRRLYVDLLGVLPSVEELAASDADVADGWYERLVQRLLEDPRHGERWARHWMDIWRYSDWWGLGEQLRNSQLHIWHWRDWIVESLNEDLPYDEMIRLMLAADELHPTDPSKLRATGLLARNYFLFNRNQWLDETVEHISKGFLGITANCAKCHDHKYDPIDQTEYYRLRAIFEPYHVRLDMVPGEADFGRDAIPRVFDGELDAPTYLFVRGQESQPDKSTPLKPGVPAFLAFRELNVRSLELPPEAWQPERRPWVADTLVAQARRQESTAEQEVASARARLAVARTKVEELERDVSRKEAENGGNPNSPTPANAPPSLVDRFESLDAAVWKTFGGKWTHEPGRLRQSEDGPQRAGLRLLRQVPSDFDATMRFTILGGSQWRSVTLCFDSTTKDPSQEARAGESELVVYVSAVAGGSKVQAAFNRGGQWTYPVEAMVRRPIELNREYTLRVQTRGRLINAYLDGEFMLAWHAPIDRLAGALQLTTFDALAEFHEFSLAPLAPSVLLREPGAKPMPVTTVAAARQAVFEAEGELRVAESRLGLAVAERESLVARVAAWQAQWNSQVSEGAGGRVAPGEQDSAGPESSVSSRDSDVVRKTHAEAVLAERKVNLAKARQKLANAELARLRAPDDKRPAADMEVTSARAALDAAEQAARKEPLASDAISPLVGARWTPTRFRSSGADDPAVTFMPRSSGRRRALAEWMTDRDNPLTARVAVNHIWTRHMGVPLVPTLFDFGRKGAAPTHPELLDWLAAEFMENGWSIRHLHRLIVTSSAYRMSSSNAEREAEQRVDPENLVWWRRSSTRVESQVVRDSLLALAGSLDKTRGGAPVPPKDQAESRRRSLYFFHSNNDRNLFLTTFDEAAVKECYRREQSIVPQQALALTNSRLVLDLAPLISDQITRSIREEDRADDREFVRRAFRLLLGFQPGDAEVAASLQALGSWRALPANSRPHEYALLVWSLVNHNDFVTLR